MLTQIPKEPSLADPAAQHPPSILPRMIAGSIGSVVVALVVTPLEVVKIRQQAGRAAPPLPPNVSLCPRGCGTFVLNNGLMECLLPKSCVPYFDAKGQLTEAAKKVVQENRRVGTFAYVRRIFLQEGMAGIYAGLAPTLVMSVPNTVLYFTAYDEISLTLKRKMPENESSSVWIPLISGSSARTLASFVTAPLELIRTRQASLVGQSQAAPGLHSEFRSMIREGGVTSLYRGLAPTLWRDAPFSAIYWLGVEQFKLLWNPNQSEPTAFTAAGQAFVNGAAAGMIAAAATTPFDVIKTRQQMVRTATVTENSMSSESILTCHHDGAVAYKQQPSSASAVAEERSVFKMMRQVVKEEGVSGLWRGNQTRMIKVAPACAIMISCYEFGKRVME
jgi:solute carrier family 25, member 39/40